MFTTDITQINHDKYVFQADPMYKTKEFQQKHKYALIKILIQEHKKYYKQNKSIIQIPQSIIDRTHIYLELSCNIVQWFKEHYKETSNNNICKIKDVFDEFCESDYYSNLSKSDKRKYNKSYFFEYLSSNIFFRKYYHERYNSIRNVLKGWEKNENNDELI